MASNQCLILYQQMKEMDHLATFVSSFWYTLLFKSLRSVKFCYWKKWTVYIQQAHNKIEEKVTVKTFTMLQKLIFQINAVLFNFLVILKKMYHGFHKTIKQHNCFQGW